MAISLVGSKTFSFTGVTTAQAISLTDLTGGSDTAPSAGDLVVVFYQINTASDIALGVDTAGYTEVAELYSNDTEDTNLSVSYKVMGGTPDTSVTVSAPSASDRDCVGVIFVFRGVNTTTPIDATTTTATGINSLLANPPSITPVTAGAWIVAGGASGNNGQAGVSYSSSNLTGFKSVNSNVGAKGSSAGAGYYSSWTSGAFDPAAFTFSGIDGTAYSWAAATLALRPASANNYTLTASPGSFVLSGQAASLKAGRSVTAAAGSFSLSGQAATLKAGRVLISAAGSFTLSGQAATLYRAITLTAGAGSFTLSGQTASFGLTRTLSAGAGSFSLSGQTAGLAVTRVLSAGPGAFTLTGKAATLTRTGSYSLTCDAGDFTLSAQTVGLAATRLLAAGAGSFTLSGQAASLTAGRTLAAGTGDFTLAGQDAGLTYTPNASAYTLSAEAGVFTLNGQAAALAYVSNEAATQPTGGGGGEFKPSKRLRQIERQRQKARKRLDDYLTRAFDLVDGVAPESEAPEPVAEQVIERLAVMPDPTALRLVAGIRAELAVLRRTAEEAQRLRDEDDAIIAILLAA